MTRDTKEQIFEMGNEDNFFSPIQNTKPFLKLAAQGFAGTGKTYTLALIACGLYERIGSTKPIVVFDTEESSKFLIPLFKKHNIPAVNKRSRSLADLKATFQRLREGYADILIIDSISHVWENFLEAYKKQKNRTRLEFQDWGIIKPAWKTEFSDPFVRDPYHCLMTGRAGYEYDNEKNEETGKREIFKSGVKMKVEGETAYEPDILIYMERFEHILEEKKEIYRQATVLKDRSTVLDGCVFRDPSYSNFEPAIDILLEGAEAKMNNAQVEGDDTQLIKREDDKREYLKRRDIALENIEGLIVEAFPGSTAQEKKHKVACLEYAYKTKSWTEIKSLHPEVLESGMAKLRQYITNTQKPAVESEEEPAPRPKKSGVTAPKSDEQAVATVSEKVAFMLDIVEKAKVRGVLQGIRESAKEQLDSKQISETEYETVMKAIGEREAMFTDAGN